MVQLGQGPLGSVLEVVFAHWLECCAQWNLLSVEVSQKLYGWETVQSDVGEED